MVSKPCYLQDTHARSQGFHSGCTLREFPEEEVARRLSCWVSWFAVHLAPNLKWFLLHSAQPVMDTRSPAMAGVTQVMMQKEKEVKRSKLADPIYYVPLALA